MNANEAQGNLPWASFFPAVGFIAAPVAFAYNSLNSIDPNHLAAVPHGRTRSQRRNRISPAVLGGNCPLQPVRFLREPRSLGRTVDRLSRAVAEVLSRVDSSRGRPVSLWQRQHPR